MSTTFSGLVVPPGACDCHMHVFGPVSRYPWAPKRSYNPGEASVAAWDALAQASGIERVVVVQPSAYGTDNRCTVDAIRAWGGKARGIAVLEADVAEAELAALDQAGIRGVRANLVSTGGAGERPEARVQALAERLAPLGWHLQIFAKPDIFMKLAPTLAALPVPVVVDHMGLPDPKGGLAQPAFQALLRLVESGNGWVKLAGSDRVSNDNEDFDPAIPFARALIAASPDRVVWGSDWPHIGWHTGSTSPAQAELPYRKLDYAKLVGMIALWTDDSAIQRKILADNPARLYGF